MEASTPAKERFQAMDHRVASLESPLLQPMAPKTRSVSEESGFSDILLHQSSRGTKQKKGKYFGSCFQFLDHPFACCRVLMFAVPLFGFLLSKQWNTLSSKKSHVSLGTLWGSGLSTLCLIYVM
jgi:hypothetical protein